MFKWYREYISVLTVDHAGLLGAFYGLSFGVSWFFFHQTMQSSLKEHPLAFWALLMLIAAVVGRAAALALAFWVRRKHPGRKPPAKAVKLTVAQQRERRRIRWYSLGSTALLLGLSALGTAGVLSPSAMTIGILLTLVAMTLILRRLAPAVVPKPGSLAAKLRRLSWWIIGISFGAIALMELWVRLVILRH